MTRRLPLPVFMALVLAIPLLARGQDKDKKKATAAPQAAGPAAADLVRQAEEKIAGGDGPGATTLLQKAAALPDAASDLGIRIGRLLEANHDLDSAIDAYRAAAGAPSLAAAAKGEALGRMAVLQETRGMVAFPESAAAAAAADPEGAWPALALARLRAREGKAEEALTLAQKAVAKGGGAAAQAALGRAQEEKGDWAAAEAAYKAATAADAQDIGAAVGLARVMRRTGRATEAAPLIEKVTTAYPGAVDAYKESARIKIALGRAAEAFGDASTAAALAENDADAHRVVQEAAVAKALAYVAQNQADLAIQDLSALRDQSPNVAPVRVGLGRALAARRQTDAAIVELSKAAELEPGLAEAHYQLGYVQQMLKRDPAAAVAAYDKAVGAEPANLDYRTSLGKALMEAKQLDRAVIELSKITADSAYTKPDAWILLGEAQIGAKRYKDALTPLQKAASIVPNNPQVEADLAWAYFGLKDAANFKAHGAKARTLGYKEPTFLQYLARIEAGEPIK